MKIKIIKKKNLDEILLTSFYVYVQRHEIEVVEDINKADLLVVFGGDGTLLIAAQEILKKDVPILAVNMGSLGYLAVVKIYEAIDILDKFQQKKYEIEKRNFLEIKYQNRLYYGLNEMVIAKGGIESHLITVEVKMNNLFVNKYRADGIIVATPTGSTAYSLSAGGPIIHPSLSAVCITPLSPQSLSTRPIVVDGLDKLEFNVFSRDDDVHMNIDGNIHFKINRMDIIEVRLSNKGISLIKPQKRDYFKVLREKLKWGDSILS